MAGQTPEMRDGLRSGELRGTSAKLAPKKYGDIHQHEVKHSGRITLQRIEGDCEEKHNAEEV